MEIPSSIPLPKEVPEKILIWRQQQAEMIEKKDQEEKEAIEKLKQSGEEELQTFYKTNKMNLEKIRANNRMNENVEIESDNKVNDDDLWKSVVNNLCDFSQTKVKNRDVSRMRSIFLQLKQTPLKRNVA